MSELVTGEAVALELRPARLPSRALAVLLDLVVAVAVYIAVTIGLVAATASLDEAAQIAVSIASFILVLVGAPIAVETLSQGRSLGKMACGLRVVRDDGGPIRFRHALVRGAIGVIEILLTFGVVACVASLVSARGRRLGDVFAGTLVVRERVPTARGGFVPPPPPWLAGRFSGLDLSAVPDGLWLAVRQYLTRMQQLDPQVSWRMAERLAADLAARTGAPAPQGVPPAAYLAAVLQERQAREARRAFGNGPAAHGPVRNGAVAPPAGAGGWPQPAQASGPYGPPTAQPNSAQPNSEQRSVEQPAAPAPIEEPSAQRPGTGFVPPA
ncbi:integral membrane protein [Streptomyces davaonensis JCM 4913]|uniref:Integral membrane protein n=1 Tax=Streptomyces davaonensis (strain DSM 101723 / JCM 4913 / KCC S-0913 / 768) TaxID=1214101 RepID=K4R035_STRDJ|nr:RDD family protein [Streptomyces davaonensis]CCK29651.1 integral membrane protein [Streptomyces davaonensis JCM 4913]